MATIKSFKDLEIWQLANDLEQRVYIQLQKGILSKDYELKNQMLRSSGSIMDNIAEGFGRGGRLEFIQFLSISAGSAAELQSQLIRCLNRKHISKETFEELNELANKVSNKIGAMIQYLNKSLIKGQKFNNRSVEGKKNILNEPDVEYFLNLQ